MKKLLVVFLLSCLLVSFSKPNAAEFTLSFSTYNHGQMHSYTWRLNQNKLEVVYYEWGGKEETVVYSTIIKPEAIRDLQALNFDGLEDNYDNSV